MNVFEDYANRIIQQLDINSLSINEIESRLLDCQKKLDPDTHIEKFDSEKIGEFRFPENDATNQKAIENGILANGMVSLAFYKSIHFLQQKPFQGNWGIFIFDYGISYLSNEIASFYPNRFSKKERDYFAAQILLLHEQFHFLFDSWVISYESATKRHLYKNYHHNFYLTYHPQDIVFEESLANLHSLHRIKRYGIYNFVKEFMLSQGGAYSYIFSLRRSEFLQRLASQLFNCGASRVINRFLPEHEPFIANLRNEDQYLKQCPIFLVKNANPSIFVDPSICLPTISEIDKGFLKKYCDGVEYVSDHKYYRIDNKQKIKVPNPHQKNMKLFEFKNVIMKAGLKNDEYFKERSRTDNWRKDVPREEVKPSLI